MGPRPIYACSGSLGAIIGLKDLPLSLFEKVFHCSKMPFDSLSGAEMRMPEYFISFLVFVEALGSTLSSFRWPVRGILRPFARAIG